jgi:adenosylhomocysteine nucleosidase
VPTVTSEIRTVLVVAAESFELKYIRPRADEHWVLKANGPGKALAGEAADAVGSQVDVVLSVGLCGALAEELEIGQIVVGSSVNGVMIELPQCSGSFVSGPIASIDWVAQTVAEKRQLRETGAVAVEMESAAVLERARAWKVPFYCIRAVSDRATEGFALDLNAARDEVGRFKVSRLLAQAVRRPIAGFPELLRLRRNSEAAAKALGEFIGNCSF